MSFFKWYEKQLNQHPAVTIGGTLAALGVAVWGVKKSGIFNRKESGQKTFDELNKELQNPSQPQSYANSQYATWAETLQSAMVDLGTDEDAIIRVMGYMKNDTDVKKLIQAFGLRDYKLFGITSFRGGLEAWLSEEVSSYWIDKINSIFKQKGITIRF